MQSFLHRSAFYLTCGAVIASLFSIAVANILIALALAAMLASGDKFRFPPVLLPLGLFFLGTIVALALSPDPWAGRPQIRKFFVFLFLLLVASVIRKVDHAGKLLLLCAAVGSLSAIRALVQFAQQMRLCGESYGCIIGERITGFMSHWMTFGGQMMMLSLLLAAWLFFGPVHRFKWAGWGCLVVLCAALVANGTRGIWLATAVGAAYLVWYWKRWLVALGPVVLALVVWLGPAMLRQRFTSAWQPHGELDSNAHRIVTWRTGWRMIRAHPWFGVGPERVGPEFEKYIPPDVFRLPLGWYGHLHNIYLHYAAELGIPTMLMLMWLLGKMLYDWIRALRRAPPGRNYHRYLLHGAIAVMLAILVEGVFEKNLGDSEVLMLFLATAGCAYTAAETGKADARA